jgi:hypothetical protein
LINNLRQFYETYPNSEIVLALLTQLRWTHHRIIMSRCKNEAERLFYLELAATERYSTLELDRQINSGIFERTVSPMLNFHKLRTLSCYLESFAIATSSTFSIFSPTIPRMI